MSHSSAYRLLALVLLQLVLGAFTYPSLAEAAHAQPAAAEAASSPCHGADVAPGHPATPEAQSPAEHEDCCDGGLCKCACVQLPVLSGSNLMAGAPAAGLIRRIEPSNPSVRSRALVFFRPPIS